MFSNNNKYINKFYSVISNNLQSNNVQTTNCVATNIYTDHIYELKRLGLNNNNPAYTLDVNGNINFNGNLFKDGKTYGIGGGYWNLIGDDIINANDGAVIIDTWIDMTNNSYINFDLNSFGFKIQNSTSTPYTISPGEFATLRGINTNTTIQNQLTNINAITANISSNTTIGGNTTLSGYVGINSNPLNTYNLNVNGTENITGLLTTDSIALTSPRPVYSSNSVVPKSYVDTLASGIILLSPCACATTSTTDTSAWIYNGTSQFTDVSTSLEIDGYTVQNGNRILVQYQLNQVQNGVYVYNQSDGILTRAADLAYGSNATGVTTFVRNGTVNKKTTFLQTNYEAITGEDNLVFTQFYSIDFSINNTLELTGNTLGVNPTLTLTSLETTGNTTVNSDLQVNGTSNLVGLITGENGLIVTNGIQTDTLDVTGSSTFNNITASSLTVRNNESVGGTLDVTGATTLTGNLNANSDLRVGGNTTLSGYVGINSSPLNTYNLNVNGTENITGLLTSDSIVLTSQDPIYTSNSVVPKSYVDAIASGIVLLSPCACATTSNGIWTYNGTSQFTGVSTSLVIDGYAVQNGERVLVQNQTNQVQNGIYVYNKNGGILTRAADLAYLSDASNVVTFIKNGTANRKTSFLQTNYGAITGQDNLVFSPLNTFDFGINNTLQLTGSTLGVNPTLTLTSLQTTGNTNVNGNLQVNGTSTFTGLLTANGGIQTNSIQSSNIITNSIQSPDPTTNIDIGTTLTMGDINMGTTYFDGQNVALNWGASSNQGQLTFRGGSFNLFSTGNYYQECGAVYPMNIATRQTSGALNIGTNTARTGVINIGNSSGTDSTGRTINIGGGGTGSFITNIMGGVINIANGGTSFFNLNASGGCGYSIGSNATSGSITIGNNSVSESTTVTNIANGAGQKGAINIGNQSSNGRLINIGGTATGSVTTIAGNTVTLTPKDTIGTLNLGDTMTGGTIVMGGTVGGTTSINIGNGSSQTGQINIGAQVTNKTILIGSAGAGTTTIRGGNASLLISNSGTLVLGGDSTGGTITMGTGLTAGSIQIGGTTGGTTTIGIGAGTSQSGTINIGTGTTAKSINIGAINSGTTTTALGGSEVYIGGNNTTTLQANPIGASGILNLGTNMTGGTITIGGTAGGTTTFAIGNGSSQTGPISIGAGASAKTITIGSNGIGDTTILGLNVVCSGTNATLRGTNITQIGDTNTGGEIKIGRTDATATNATINIGAGSANTGAINMGTGASAKTITIGSAASTVNVNGTITVTGTLSTSGIVTATGGFVSGSDYRIKENITPLDSSFTVDELTPIRFTNKNTGKTDIGFIAHELQEFYPELVTGEKDGEELQSVNYQGLIGILIQEIKNLKQEVKEVKNLKQEVEELKQKLNM